jgi:hypothetical protein
MSQKKNASRLIAADPLSRDSQHSVCRPLVKQHFALEKQNLRARWFPLLKSPANTGRESGARLFGFPNLYCRVLLEIRNSLRNLYLADPRPWLVGFSGGKDSTMLTSMIFAVVESIPEPQRTKAVSILCTDTRVEIPAIVEMIEKTLAKMQNHSRERDLSRGRPPILFRSS